MHVNITLNLLVLLGILLNGLVSCAKFAESRSAVSDVANPNAKGYFEIALAGNAFVTYKPNGATETITSDGLTNWTDQRSVTSIYFRVEYDVNASIKLRAKSVHDFLPSTIKVTIDDETEEILITGTVFWDYEVGTFALKPGYVQVDLQGISPAGTHYGVVSHLLVSGLESAEIVYVDDPQQFYYARRGPSCYLVYQKPTDELIEYYYGELLVPLGEDPIGSFFMSIGFSQGYFGIQVISESERRILFSVWSPHISDDPSSTPDELRVKLNRKGPGVTDNQFGNEGTGGQSYKEYNWTTETTMKFLIKAQPDDQNSTDFTAWIALPTIKGYSLIASWKRPHTSTYLTGYKSFVENFYETCGYLERKIYLTNQWVRTLQGTWFAIRSAKFTVDDTYLNNQRIDAAGGVEGDDLQFYLQNGGFFNYRPPPGSISYNKQPENIPDIDFDSLP